MGSEMCIRDSARHSRPDLAQFRVEVGSAAHFQLQRVDPAARRAVLPKHIAAGIGPVVRHPALRRRQMPQRRCGEQVVARRAETIADHEFDRTILAISGLERRHGMQVEQQHGAPLIADLFEDTTQSRVVGVMDRIDPLGQICGRKRFAPDFAQPRNCLLYTSPSPRDGLLSRMPSSA